MHTLQEFFRDINEFQELVRMFDPVVRAVDGIAGERVSIRVSKYKHRVILCNIVGFYTV